MALTKEVIEDKIEVVGEYKEVQIRTAVWTNDVKKAYKDYMDSLDA